MKSEDKRGCTCRCQVEMSVPCDGCPDQWKGLWVQGVA